jgi:hypothetical protein
MFQISVIVEFLAGRVPDMLLKMIALYRPDCERRHLHFTYLALLRHFAARLARR